MLRPIVALGLALALPVTAFSAPQRVHEGETFDLVRVTERVYAVFRNAVGSNAAIVLLDEGTLVVDTHASPAAAREMLRAIAALDAKPVRWVVNTHWHTDHMLGNEAYVEAFPGQVELISHHTAREDMEQLAAGQLPVTLRFIGEAVDRLETWLESGDDHTGDGEELERVRRFVADQKGSLPAMEGMSPTLPTLTFRQELRLWDRGSPVQLHYFGEAHTRGDVVVYLPEEKVVVTGDLLTFPTLHFGRSSHPVEWLSALRQLAELDFEHTVPGHGREVLSGKGYLTRVTGLLGEVVHQVRTAIDEGAESAAAATEGVDPAALRESWLALHPGTEEELDRAMRFVEDAAVLTYLDLKGRLPHNEP